MSRFEDLPYRPCVGCAVFNHAGRVFIGRRASGPEHIDETHVWQMPQGGIDAGEDPWPAALRELYEETNIRSVRQIGAIDDWLTYDIPRELLGQAWGGKYRGQPVIDGADLSDRTYVGFLIEFAQRRRPDRKSVV